MIRYDDYLLVPIYLLSAGFCLVRFYILLTQISNLPGKVRDLLRNSYCLLVNSDMCFGIISTNRPIVISKKLNITYLNYDFSSYVYLESI